MSVEPAQKQGCQTELLMLFFLAGPFPELKCQRHGLYIPPAALSLYLIPVCIDQPGGVAEKVYSYPWIFSFAHCELPSVHKEYKPET